MRYLSTGGAYETDLIGAVSRGLAPDGCLYVPEELPRFDPDAIRGETVAGIAAELLAPFFKGSPLAPDLNALCEDTFNFPIPLVPWTTVPARFACLKCFTVPRQHSRMSVPGFSRQSWNGYWPGRRRRTVAR